MHLLRGNIFYLRFMWTFHLTRGGDREKFYHKLVVHFLRLLVDVFGGRQYLKHLAGCPQLLGVLGDRQCPKHLADCPPLLGVLGDPQCPKHLAGCPLLGVLDARQFLKHLNKTLNKDFPTSHSFNEELAEVKRRKPFWGVIDGNSVVPLTQGILDNATTLRASCFGNMLDTA